MQRRTIRLAGLLALTGALALAHVAPAATLAADPSSAPAASEQASDQPTDQPTEAPSDGNVVVDPTFVTAPTATPVGAVLGATGRPPTTPPPTDAVAGDHSAAGAASQGIVLLLLALATISLVVAPKPEVRRR